MQIESQDINQLTAFTSHQIRTKQFDQVDGQISGVAVRDPDRGWEVYATNALQVPFLTDSTEDLKANFWRNGYLVFPGLLADEAGNSQQTIVWFAEANHCHSTFD